MIEVNVSALKSEISKINKLLEEYQNIKINLFKELEDTYENSWNDGHSIRFKDSVLLDDSEAEKIILTLKDKRDVYEYISTKYGEIGNKIKCDFEMEEKLIESIDECKNACEEIKNELTGAHIDLTPAMNEIESAKNDLETFKMEIKKILEYIKELESEINTKISQLTLVKINEFNFNVTTEIGDV